MFSTVSATKSSAVSQASVNSLVLGILAALFLLVLFFFNVLILPARAAFSLVTCLLVGSFVIKGFGFIAPDDGGSDVCVHISAVEGAGLSGLDDNQKVSYDIEENKGKGNFEDGLESIKDWCRKKGIDVKLAYVIFVNILNKGIEPQPFLYPA